MIAGAPRSAVPVTAAAPLSTSRRLTVVAFLVVSAISVLLVNVVERGRAASRETRYAAKGARPPFSLSQHMGGARLPADRDSCAGRERFTIEDVLRRQREQLGAVVGSHARLHDGALVLDVRHRALRGRGFAVPVESPQLQAISPHRHARTTRGDNVVAADEAGDEFGARPVEDLARTALL